MKKTNKSAGVQYKLIFYYALFALLPMFLIAVFTYGNTKKIQLERLYEELSYQMEHTIKNLDEKAIENKLKEIAEKEKEKSLTTNH